MDLLVHTFEAVIVIFNPIPDGEGGRGSKKSPTSFSPVTSTNVGISPQNFLTFSVIELEPRPSLKKSGFSGQILINLRL